MLQTVLIMFLIAGVLLYVVRHYVKLSRTGSCGCSGCSGCSGGGGRILEKGELCSDKEQDSIGETRT